MFWTFEYERKSVHKAEILIKEINLALIKMMITIITNNYRGITIQYTVLNALVDIK